MTKIYPIENYQYLRVFDDIEGYLRFEDHEQSAIVSVAQMLGSPALAFYYISQEHRRGQVLRDVRRYLHSQPNAITENGNTPQEIEELLGSNDYRKFFNFIVGEIQQLESQHWQGADKAISIRILYHLAVELKQIIDESRVSSEQ